MVPCCHVDLLVLAAAQCSTCNLAQTVSGSEWRAGLEGVCTGSGRHDGVGGVWVVVAPMPASLEPSASGCSASALGW